MKDMKEAGHEGPGGGREREIFAVAHSAVAPISRAQGAVSSVTRPGRDI